MTEIEEPRMLPAGSVTEPATAQMSELLVVSGTTTSWLGAAVGRNQIDVSVPLPAVSVQEVLVAVMDAAATTDMTTFSVRARV